MRTSASKSFDHSKFPRPGVIKEIYQILVTAGERERPVSKDQILDVLERKFPERQRASMAITVTAQLSRLPKERGLKIQSFRESGGFTRYAAVIPHHRTSHRQRSAA